MKLLFVIPEYGESIRGGIATFYNHLIPGLRRAGCTVEVCLANEQGLSTDLRQQSNVRITSIDPALVEEARARLAQFAAFPELQRVLARSFAAFRRCKNGDYDVVETTDWGLLYVPWVTVESAIPVVVQLHGSNGQVAYYDPREGRELSGLTTRLLEAALLGRADELQACSPANACDWFRLLGKDVHHIWPGWENSNLSSERCTPEVDASGRGIVVARIQKWKGPETLCQAIALLGDKAPQILWVGRDTASPRSVSAYLKRTFPSVWEKTILPIGEMSFESTAHLQATAKFAVVPSRWDTFSLSAVEAMWAKKVVICSEGAGASSLIRHGENGFRFRPDKPDELAGLLLEVDKMVPELRLHIGQQAHNTIVSELDLDRICDIRIQRYERLKASRIPRRQHHWIDSLFGSGLPEPEFAVLGDISTRNLARLALRRMWRRFRI